MLRLLMALSTLLTMPPGAQAPWVIGPAMQPVLAGALTDPQAPPLADGWRPTSVAVQPDRVIVHLAQVGGGAEPAQTFELSHPPRDVSPTASDTAQFRVQGPAGPVRTALVERLRTLDKTFVWSAGDSGDVRDAGDVVAELQTVAKALTEHRDEQARTALAALCAKLAPDHTEPTVAWALAILLRQQGDLERSRTYTEGVLVATRDTARLSAPAFNVRAGALASLGHDGEVTETLAACRKLHSQPGACHFGAVIDWYKAHGAWAQAGRYYDLQLGDGQHATLQEIAERSALAMRMGDSGAELRWAQLARDRFADQPDALELWATACFRASRFEEAVTTYEALYHRDPQRPSVLAHLSGVFNRMHGTHGDAQVQAAWQRLADKLAQRRADKRDVVAQFLYAVKVFYDADFDAAIALFAELQPTLRTEPRVPIYLAMANYWSGRQQEAEKFAAQAVQLGPLDPDVYYVRSKVFQDKDMSAAAKDLRRYIELAEAPGAIAFADKTARVRKELELLEHGERPPDWDRPGFDQQSRGPTRWLAAGLAVLIGAIVLWQRRREARA